MIQCKKTNAEPVFEEFIPLKKSCDESEEDKVQKEAETSKDKKNWLSSVQLWNNDVQSEYHFNTKMSHSVLEMNKVVLT